MPFVRFHSLCLSLTRDIYFIIRGYSHAQKPCGKVLAYFFAMALCNSWITHSAFVFFFFAFYFPLSSKRLGNDIVITCNDIVIRRQQRHKDTLLPALTAVCFLLIDENGKHISLVECIHHRHNHTPNILDVWKWYLLMRACTHLISKPSIWVNSMCLALSPLPTTIHSKV